MRRRTKEAELIIWDDTYFQSKVNLVNKIVFLTEEVPLYMAAYISLQNPKGVVTGDWGKNNHITIFLNDLLVPNISIGKQEKISILEGESVSVLPMLKQKIKLFDEAINRKMEIGTSILTCYANIGSVQGIHLAKNTNAVGIGIIRSEFIAVRFLASILDELYDEGHNVLRLLDSKSEADVIYLVARHPKLSHLLRSEFYDVLKLSLESFSEGRIVIRGFDLENTPNDHLGLRGVRRSILENWAIFDIILEAIGQLILENPSYQQRIGVLIPLVSNYDQITQAARFAQSKGFSFSDTLDSQNKNIAFGWKIETPSSVTLCGLWLDSFFEEYDSYPSFLGIGSNDLTQFTLAVDRNLGILHKSSQDHNELLYNEWDVSIIYSLYQIRDACNSRNIMVFLHGELASEAIFFPILQSLEFIPSMSSVKIQKYLEEVTNEYFGKISLKEYLNSRLLAHYPSRMRSVIIKDIIDRANV